jgi:hypothetical protein
LQGKHMHGCCRLRSSGPSHCSRRALQRESCISCARGRRHRAAPPESAAGPLPRRVPVGRTALPAVTMARGGGLSGGRPAPGSRPATLRVTQARRGAGDASVPPSSSAMGTRAQAAYPAMPGVARHACSCEGQAGPRPAGGKPAGPIRMRSSPLLL